MQRLKTRLFGFLFSPSTDTWLAVLRVGLRLGVTIYSLSFETIGPICFRELHAKWRKRCCLWKAILSQDSDGLLLRRHNLAYMRRQSLFLAWACLLAVGCGLVVGVASRFSAIAAWFLHLCAAKSGGFVSYGMDNFLTIGLFYLMLSPLPDRYSLDWRLRKSQPKNPQLLGFWRRVLQLHLSIIYFFSGLTKCLGPGWWNGSSVWRALIRPPFNIIDPEILVRWKYLFPVAGIFICLLEITYPFFIWNSKTRKIWLICICAMHVGIGVTMGMYLFALIMIVLNVAAFGPGCFAQRTKRSVYNRRELLPDVMSS